MQYSRRKFIKVTSLASASLLPVVNALSQALDMEENSISAAIGGDFNTDLEFHLLDKNLLNLHFYFINVQKQRGKLSPKDNKPSYMIVRLPQQHISEKGFFGKPFLNPQASMSGFSFLAFELFPTHPNKKQAKYIPFNITTLLAWNDDQYFKLITLIEWLRLVKQSATTKGVEEKDPFAELSFVNQTDISKKDASALEPIEVMEGYEPHSKIYKEYRTRVIRLLSSNPHPGHFIPITLFEVPEKLLLVPFFRSELNSTQFGSNRKIRFYKNERADGDRKKGSDKDKQPVTTKYEVWVNRLSRESTPTGQGTDNTFIIENPSFRAIGVIEKPQIGGKDIPCEDFEKKCKENCEKEKTKNSLPSLLTKTELTYLTQYAKHKDKNEDKDFTEEIFDIKEIDGFFFTGLGVITHLRYSNIEKKQKDIDLIEYEHVITQGRDVFIKVARLGYNCKTGQKYKHVIEGRRKIEVDNGYATSFIELKQYVECIDITFSYNNFLDTVEERDGKKVRTYSDIWKTYFEIDAGILLNVTPIIAPALHYPAAPKKPVYNPFCHYRALPYVSTTTIEKERVPVMQLQDDIVKSDICELECSMWFWPILEKEYEDKTKVLLDDYYMCEQEAIEHNGQRVGSKTPFMFIRASLLECAKSIEDLSAVYRNYFKVDGQVFIDRRKTMMNNQKIAYTPSTLDHDGKRSDINILETEFKEIYFRVRPAKGAAAQNVPYILFPQVLRTKVFSDHVRDLAQQKIASVIEYHPDYIMYDYDTVGEGKYLNAVKLVLKNTDAFSGLKPEFINKEIIRVVIEPCEEIANNTYKKITSALQEAKEKLGNLVTPDIIPDTISLEKFGLTIPSNIRESIAKGTAVFQQGADAITKIQQFSPRELLRGKLSDILGGIELTKVLQELIPEQESPLFKIEKALGEIEDAVKKTDIYKDIINTGGQAIADISQRVNDVKRTIDDYKNNIDELKDSIKNKREEIRKWEGALKEKIPNVDTLKHLSKDLFEAEKTKILNVLEKSEQYKSIKTIIEEGKKKADTFVAKELKLVQNEYKERKKKLDGFLGEIENDAAALQKIIESTPELKDLDVFVKIKWKEELKFLKNNYENIIDKTDVFVKEQSKILFATIEDNIPYVYGNVIVYINLTTLELQKAGTVTFGSFALDKIAECGFVQLERKLQEIRQLLEKNINGNEFQRKVCEDLVKDNGIYKKIVSVYNVKKTEIERFQKESLQKMALVNKWRSDVDTFIAKNINATFDKKTELLNALRKIKDRTEILVASVSVDLLRKADPYFYYEEYKRLEKDCKDVKARFHTDVINLYDDIKAEAEKTAKAYTSAVDVYLADTLNLKDFNEKISKQANELTNVAYTAITKVESNIGTIVTQIEVFNKELNAAKGIYENALKSYMQLVEEAKGQLEQTITTQVNAYINRLEKALVDEVGAENILAIQDKINKAKNLYKLLTSIKQQDLSYTWNTTSFRDVNLGIIGFKKYSNPNTRLDVDVRATTYFTQGKFPPVIQKVTVSSENKLSNFGISIFSILTISFSEVTYSTGTDCPSHFSVKIRDVQFGGALSFVQAFEAYLKTLGQGLILNIQPDHVALGYSLPIPSIQTPGFAFFNLTLAFDFRLYFDKRPMRFGFSLATIENKFGIAVYIFAGFGYFSIVADPKRGIVEIDAALEAGAWAGFRLGPIRGEVKLAFGFRYTKGDFGTRLEGYIVAEGRLTVWVIEVSARIYLGIVSQNSYVEGRCSVTYSVKIGFFKRSFTGVFYKKIAGAENKNANASTGTRDLLPTGENKFSSTDKFQTDIDQSRTIPADGWNNFSKEKQEQYKYLNNISSRELNEAKNILEHYLAELRDKEDDKYETYSVSKNDWDAYFNTF